MNELKIHDIKDITQIPDISFYIFLGLLILAILVLLSLIFIIYKYFKNKKQNKRKEYYKILKEIDLKESKKSAYEISKYTRFLVSNEREKNLFNELNEELEKFKYKKEVEPLSDEVKILFGRFMDIVDV
ncbi:hypothetical protein [Arcobacter sp. LA11]|uniref:hypothetical protein n=1 Tax=Arcobacter sp. LA11 TaxID=1898176 RepID=UPI0009352C34|nr:hypothetical protein [Arcobacter sp. LA11]